MTSEFTKKDRDFIIKIAKNYDVLAKRVKVLEDEKKITTHAKAVEASKKQVEDTIRKNAGAVTKFGVFNSDSSVNVEYGENPPTMQEQKELVVSLYKTLYEICDDNGITSLTVTIKPD